MWPEAATASLLPQSLPEVQRVSVAATLLQLLAMGLTTAEVATFPWLEPPSPAAVDRGLALLQLLGALQAAAETVTVPAGDSVPQVLSAHGRAMAALPLDPQYGHLLLVGAKAGVGVDMAAITALLSVDGVWVAPGRDKQGACDAARRKFAALEGDHVTLLNALRAFERVVVGAAREVVAALPPPTPPPPVAAATVAPQPAPATTLPAPAGKRMRFDDEGHEVTAPIAPPPPAPPPIIAAASVSSVTAREATGPAIVTMSDSTPAAGDDGGGSGGVDDVVAVGDGIGEWVTHKAERRQAERKQTPTVATATATAVAVASVSPFSCARVLQSAVAVASAADAAAGVAASAATRRWSTLRAINSRVHAWCVEHFLSFRALRKAVAVRDQLADVCAQAHVALLPPASAAAAAEWLARKGTSPSAWLSTSFVLSSPILSPPLAGTDAFCRALAAGLAHQVAHRLPSDETGGRAEYRTLDGVLVGVHPSSSLVLVYSFLRNRAAAAAAAAKRKGGTPTAAGSSGVSGDLVTYPDTVVFSELVRTSRAYMRYVTRIEREWLTTAGSAIPAAAGEAAKLPVAGDAGAVVAKPPPGTRGARDATGSAAARQHRAAPGATPGGGLAALRQRAAGRSGGRSGGGPGLGGR